MDEIKEINFNETGDIIDTLSGKSLKDTPEERVRQRFIGILQTDYGYPKANIAREVPVQQGSKILLSTDEAEIRADIVVYANKKACLERDQGNILFVVECKKPMIAADSQNKQGLFAYGKCNLIYVDPYNFGTVQISKLHAILENNYCELLFNLFTSDYVRNIAKDTGRIQKCLGGFKPATKDEFINCVTKELHVGHVKFTFSYSFHTMKNVELYQILYATPSIRGLEVLKDSLWDVFGGEEFHRNHVPKTSDVEQISFRKNASISSIEVRYCPKFCSPVVCSTKFATVYKGNIIKNLIMDCQSYTKYRPNETTGGIFVSWRRKEELPTGA